MEAQSLVSIPGANIEVVWRVFYVSLDWTLKYQKKFEILLLEISSFYLKRAKEVVLLKKLWMTE